MAPLRAAPEAYEFVAGQYSCYRIMTDLKKKPELLSIGQRPEIVSDETAFAADR